jgi:hypothetical protein
MSLINKIGAGVALISGITILGSLGKALLYDSPESRMFSKQIQLLENYSKEPRKIEELRIKRNESNEAVYVDLLVAALAVLPHSIGLSVYKNTMKM